MEILAINFPLKNGRLSYFSGCRAVLGFQPLGITEQLRRLYVNQVVGEMVAFFSHGQDKFSRRLKRHTSSSTCTPGRLVSVSGMGAVGSTAPASEPGRTSFVLAR
jgi:hypothetical protein